MDAPAFFPEVIAGQGQPRARVAIAAHEIGGGLDDVHPKRPDELDCAVSPVVPPKRPDDEGGLILLDGQRRLGILDPGMPGGGGAAIGVVLVQEIPLGRDRALAERVERARDIREPRQIE